MQSNTWLIASVGIAAVVFLVAGTGNGTIQTTPLEQALSPQTGASLQEESVRNDDFPIGADLLNAYYGHECVSFEEGKESGIIENSPEGECPEADTLGIFIATIPDPEGTNLDWSYDAQINSLRRALENSGFVVDRLWLPWQEERNDTSTTRSGIIRERAGELYPGAILFRQTGLSGNTLFRLLYIVGEVPTRGIYRKAFHRAAVDRWHLLTKSPGGLVPLEPTKLRIIGPTFSGSSSSLKSLLEDPAVSNGLDSVFVITGSATSLTNKRLIESATGSSGKPQVRFWATINPDPALDAVLRDSLLPVLNLTPCYVAVLQETSTQYGQNLASVTQDNQNCEDPDAQFLTIPLPMHISSLRTEYARNPEVELDDYPLSVTPSAPRISLNLQNPGRQSGNLEARSLLTAPTIDLQLDEIARTLLENNVRLVGLLATDIRDKLFLTEELRRRMRDVQFFTFESNVLYLWPEYNTSLRGMLVLSSYPLIMKNQAWTSVHRRDRVPFSSDGSLGIYNATLLQLGREDLCIEYGLPGDRRARLRPGIWLTAVGRYAFQPLQVWQAGEAAEQYVEGIYAVSNDRAKVTTQPITSSLIRSSSIGFVFNLLAFLLGIFTITVAIHLGWRAKQLIARADESLQWSSVEVQEELYRTLRFIALTGIFAPVGLFLFHLPEQVPLPEFIVIFALLFVFSTATFFALYEEIRLFLKITRTHIRPRLKGAVLMIWQTRKVSGLATLVRRTDVLRWWADVLARSGVFILGLTYFAIIVWYMIQVVLLSESDFVLLHHRSVRLDGGLSPLLPLMLGGFIISLWCDWQLRRLRLLAQMTAFEAACLERSRINPPRVTRFFTSIIMPCEENEEHVITCCTPYVVYIRERLFFLLPSAFSALLLFGLFFLALLLWFRFGSTWEVVAETPAFDLLLRFAILTGLGATTWGVYRLSAVWSALRGLLEKLSQSRLLPAFERLPQQVANVTALTFLRPSRSEDLQPYLDIQWPYLRRLHAALKQPKMAGDGVDVLDEDPLSFEEDTTFDLANEMDAVMVNPAPPKMRIVRNVGSGFEWPVEKFDAILARLWAAEPGSEEIKRVNDWVAGADVKNANESLSISYLFRRSFPGKLRLWLRAAEETTALYVVDYIEWVLQHLRRLGLFLFLSLVLTTILLSSYPYYPQSLFKLFFFGLLICTVTLLLVVMFQLNRDEVLSRIAKSKPGKIDWNRSFILNIALILIIPLLTVATSEFPEIRQYLFAWINPVLRALGGG